MSESIVGSDEDKDGNLFDILANRRQKLLGMTHSMTHDMTHNIIFI